MAQTSAWALGLRKSLAQSRAASEKKWLREALAQRKGALKELHQRSIGPTRRSGSEKS